MIQIPREQFQSLTFDLDAELAAFATALAAHASTVGVAVPVADPLVEAVHSAGGYTVVDEWAEPEPPLIAISSLAAQKRRQIHERAEAERAVIAPNYPQHEIDTWDQQLREATALTANAQAPVPFLSAMATARGWAVADLATRVLMKAGAFAVAGGEILGTQQALEDSLDAIMADFDIGAIPEAEARAQITAIAWPPGGGA